MKMTILFLFINNFAFSLIPLSIWISCLHSRGRSGPLTGAWTCLWSLLLLLIIRILIFNIVRVLQQLIDVNGNGVMIRRPLKRLHFVHRYLISYEAIFMTKVQSKSQYKNNP